MNILEEFIKIGYWEFNSKYKSNKSLNHLQLPGINFVIEKTLGTKKNVVYLFKTGSETLYIGETSRGLQSRFESYRYGFDKLEDTDNRVKIGITDELLKGNRVDIYYIQPDTEYYFGGEKIHIPLSKPIEEHLIRKINPVLNSKSL